MSIEHSLSEVEKQQAEEASPTPVGRVYNPSAAELLSESDRLYGKVSESSDLSSKIENVTEQLETIQAEVALEGGLSDYSRSVISKAYKALVGQDLLGGRLLALESVDGADDDFKDGIVEEVQNNTLNDFLVALKRSFYNNWGDTKSWYSKVTSIRETVLRKNIDCKDRASKVTGDPKTQEFIFKENLDVDNNGKVSYPELSAGLDAMLAFTEKRLTAKVDKEFEDFVVGIQRLVDGYKSKSEVDETELLKYKNLYTPPPEVTTSPLSDKTVQAKLTDSDTAELIQSKRFPGGTYVVISTPGNKSGATPYSFIENTWIKLYTDKEAEEKESVKVRTFYPNQIVYISDIIASLLDSLTYFDKSWERRDRFMTKVFGSLDKTISVISGKLTDSSLDKKTDAELRGLCRIMIRAIQLDNTFNSMLINHVIKITAQTNDLNNACLLQYDGDK